MTTTNPLPRPTATASNHEIVAAHYAAGAEGDLEGMLAPIEPDTRWTEAAGSPVAGTYVGREAVLEHVFAALGREFDGFAFALDELFDAGDAQIAIGDYSGVHRATGKPFRARVAHVWRFDQGRLATFEQFVDSAKVLESMR